MNFFNFFKNLINSLFFIIFKSFNVSGHNSKTHKTDFFLKIILKKIPGMALSIGEGQKIKIKSILFFKILGPPKNKVLKKKLI